MASGCARSRSERGERSSSSLSLNSNEDENKERKSRSAKENEEIEAEAEAGTEQEERTRHLLGKLEGVFTGASICNNLLPVVRSLTPTGTAEARSNSLLVLATCPS